MSKWSLRKVKQVCLRSYLLNRCQVRNSHSVLTVCIVHAFSILLGWLRDDPLTVKTELRRYLSSLSFEVSWDRADLFEEVECWSPESLEVQFIPSWRVHVGHSTLHGASLGTCNIVSTSRAQRLKALDACPEEGCWTDRRAWKPGDHGCFLIAAQNPQKWQVAWRSTKSTYLQVGKHLVLSPLLVRM